MACTNCSGGSSSFSMPSLQTPFTGAYQDSRGIVYTGPYLSCINVQSNTCLQDVIQAINAKVCQAVGDYTQYNFNCLSSLYTITDEASFVDSITDFVCNLATTVDNLQQQVNDNYDDLSTQIDGIINPGLVSNCPTNIIYDENSDIFGIITALDTALCNVYTQLDMSTITWDACYTPSATPTNLQEGIAEILNQICLTKDLIAEGGILPTFDNTGTCLTTPTNNDTLVDTVIKIRTRLCNTPTFLAANLTGSTCVVFTDASTLEEVIDAQNAVIDSLSANSIRAASADFTITDVDPLNPCLGKTIAINSGVVDRKVALNNADLTPGTLFDKVAAGTNVSLDFGVSNAGKLTISATGGAATDEKVKISATDSTAGYLEDKVIGDNTDPIVTTIVTPTLAGDQLQILSQINIQNLLTALFDELEVNPTLRARFCEIVNSCPIPCAPPTGVTVTLVS